MAEDAWITEKWLAAREGVQVRSTDADAMNANQGFTWISLQGIRELFLKLTGFLEYDLPHPLDLISFSPPPSFLLR